MSRARLSRPRRNRAKGFALVVTLCILTLLTIVAVAFFSSAGLERTTARAFASKEKADAAAAAAVQMATSTLRETITSFPDSATTWEDLPNASSGTTTPMTVLYLHAAPLANDATKPDPYDRAQSDYASKGPVPSNPNATGTWALPLASGGLLRALAKKNEAFPTTLNITQTDPAQQNFTDINRARDLVDANGKNVTDASGWIGSPPGAAARRAINVPWVEMREPATGSQTGKLISRYAFWIEDESFKVNANLMGDQSRGGNSPGVQPLELPLQALRSLQVPDPAISDAAAAKIVASRNSFPGKRFLEPGALDQLLPTPTPASLSFSNGANFLYTLYSAAFDVSRHGSRRLNINDLIAADGASPTPTAIRAELDRMIAAIKFHCPDFGQRFYRNAYPTPSASELNNNTLVPATNADIYLDKIAANLRDYIDADNQPTIVLADRSVAPATRPNRGYNATQRMSANEVRAFGKESGPFIQEYTLRVKVNTTPPIKMRAGGGDYDITFEYYVELWNMTNRDIRAGDLGPNPFLRIGNQPGWDAGTGQSILAGSSRDLTLKLDPATVFPANTPTVITTDPAALNTLTPTTARVVVIPVANITSADGKNDRHYTGFTSNLISGQYTLILKTRPGPYATGTFALGGTDYQTELLFGTDNGVIDSQIGAGVIEDDNVLVDNYKGARIGGVYKSDNSQFFFRGSAMLGNKTEPSGSKVAGAPQQYGDPRTNNEQLVNQADVPPSATMTRFVTTNKTEPPNTYDSRDKGVPPFGTLTDFNTQQTQPDPSGWPERAHFTAGAANAPAVIANTPLTSIGQLGDLFDPQREASSPANINFSRGGGRTLHIGQPENPAIWDGKSGSRSRNWTAWRLTDIFTANTTKDDPATSDTDESFERPGLINLNGLRRDGGAALQTLLSGYKFNAAPAADPAIADKNLPQGKGNGVDELVTELNARLDPASGGGPMFERGELSELPLFSSGTKLAGVDMTTVLDRSREELFRRAVELTTTRGSVFSIYAVGQAVQERPGGPAGAVLVRGTSLKKVTVELVPVYSPALPSTVAWDATQPYVRFASPIRYEARVLATLF